MRSPATTGSRTTGGSACRELTRASALRTCPSGNACRKRTHLLVENVQKIGGGSWYLKLGQPEPPEPTDDQLKNLDVVATIIWPQNKVATRVGRTIFSEFLGVFLDKYQTIGPVDLSSRAEWNTPTGLEQVAPGVFRVTKAGEFEVSARVKRKDGTWMNGYLRFGAIPKMARAEYAHDTIGCAGNT